MVVVAGGHIDELSRAGIVPEWGGRSYNGSVRKVVGRALGRAPTGFGLALGRALGRAPTGFGRALGRALGRAPTGVGRGDWSRPMAAPTRATTDS